MLQYPLHLHPLGFTSHHHQAPVWKNILWLFSEEFSWHLSINSKLTWADSCRQWELGSRHVWMLCGSQVNHQSELIRETERETGMLHGTDWPRPQFQVHFINPCFINCPLTDSIILSNCVEITCQNIILGSVPQGDGCTACRPDC